MSKVIRVDNETFSRLQNLAEPFVDTPSSVIERLLDYYDSRETDRQAQSQKLAPAATATEATHHGQNLFLAPASDENLMRTIARPTRLTSFQNLLTAEQEEHLRKSSKDPEQLYCWAMTESNRAKYKEMKPGDIVLFSEKNSGMFQYKGRVTAKVENEELGNKLWPNFVPTKPWRLIYFLEDIQKVKIDKTKLVVALGYDKKFVVPGLTRLNPVARDTILSKHGSMESFISSFPY